MTSRATTPAFAKGCIKPECQTLQGCICAGEFKFVPNHLPPVNYVDVVMSGFPDHTPPHFIELENESGQSISFGEWIKRADGRHVLRLPLSRKETEHG